MKVARILPGDEAAEEKRIFLTSAVKRRGIADLRRFLLDLSKTPPSHERLVEKENYHLKKWIQREYGNFGLRLFQDMSIADDETYEEKEDQFNQLFQTLNPTSK